ncbi:MAG: metallophosphoesterase [candidate division WOR-3 bacterium]
MICIVYRIFFTADTHFLHENIIYYCNRPFSSETEMNETLISNWNREIRPQDLVYHLGDFALPNRNLTPEMQKELIGKILSRLNGRVVLIRGSHDRFPELFEEWHDIMIINLGGHRVVLSHYPMLEWPNYYRGSFHLHGHVHGRLEALKELLWDEMPGMKRSVDVGVDVHGYRPISWEEVITIIRARQSL